MRKFFSTSFYTRSALALQRIKELMRRKHNQLKSARTVVRFWLRGGEL
jgi:hypothetical protein